MSSNKRGGGADEMYRNHLQGSPFQANPANNRRAIIERMYLRNLAELASNRFKWEGLPESVSVRYMETTLFYRGLAVFYKDNDYDKFLALRGGGTAYVNMIDDPTSFLVVGNNFIGKTIGAYNPARDYSEGEAETKAIPIWSNYLRMPDWDIVNIYATRLADLDHTIEINSKNARRNKVIVTSEDTKLSSVNVNRQIDEGQNGIQLKAGGPLSDLQFIQAVDLGINVDQIEKLHIVRTRMWNECMGLLGIDNANQDKKERLVADEIDANKDQTSMARYVNLNSRRIAAEQINRVHGLNVTVTYYTDEDRLEDDESADDIDTDTDNTDSEDY